MLLALIVAGIYFLVGAWGAAILWAVGTLFLLPMLGAVAALFMTGAEQYRARKRLAGTGVLLGALLATGLWAGAVGYCGYRAYLAIP